jgi:hypothetical protein
MLTEHDIETKKPLYSKRLASKDNSVEARRDCFKECVDTDGYSEVACASECGFPKKGESLR